MTIIAQHNFEDNSLAQYDTITGVTPTIQTSTVYEGIRALRVLLATQQCRIWDSYSATATIACRFYVRRASAAEETPYLWFLANGADTAGLFVRYESGVGLRLYYYDGGGQVLIATSSVALTVGTWTKIEIRANVSANPWSVAWRVNNVDQTGGSPATAATTFSQMNFGVFNYDMVWDAYFDAWKISDENAYIGDAPGYQRFVGPVQLTATAATLYTVPPKRRALIRNIFANNPSGSDVAVTLSIGADEDATHIFDADTVPAGDILFARRETNYVLEEGEVLQGFAGSTATVVLVVDGVLQAV